MLKKEYPSTFFGLKTAFALSFVIIRNIYWPMHSVRLWYDYYLLYTGGEASVSAPLVMVAPVIAMYVFITYLQFKWGRLIINNSCKALGLGVRSHSPTDESPLTTMLAMVPRLCLELSLDWVR